MNSAKMITIEETLGKKFDIDQFKKFTREFFNELEMYPQQNRQTSIWKEYNDYIAAYYKIGKYIDCEGKEIGIISVELKEEKSVERARSMQRNFVSKVLDDNSLDAALVAFYSNSEDSWRLSFVRLDYTFTEKGLSEELTPAKRYSYLVGEKEPIHTAKAQLLPIFENDKKNPTLDEIEEAFSVETVTKEFFNEYKEKYLEVKEYLESSEEFVKESQVLKIDLVKFSEQFAKKLMGQLAFLYFLQKKGWLGVGIVPKKISRQELIEIYKTVDDTKKEILKKVYVKINEGEYRIDSDLLGSDEFSEHQADHLSDIFIANSKYNKPWGSGNKAFVRDILWKHCSRNNRDFFDQYLEPFFYEALNNKRKNQYFKTFNSKIPFLNGGLFEPLEGYHWKDTNFKIPNKIFSNQDEKGKGESDGILDIFDRYNFTINENEPLEKDVAVDPEMLGKIFENLLDVKDRKSKGAFYTPREIVHYMCQESLINYLVNEVNVPYEDMKQFILYGEIIRDADSRSGVGYGKDFTIKQSIFDNIVAIDNALENVKVADPAVGSGAFPLGMLNEIVRARDNITEYIIRKDNEGEFAKKHGEEFIRVWRSNYKMKWNTIKNSIFAVDIEPSAVDITKLRLWLSVVVDQKIEDEIKGPHQLPNLDMNIQVGNSLIDEFEGIKLFDESILTKLKDDGKEESSNRNEMQLDLLVDNTEEIIREMFDLQDKYFNEEGELRKKAIKKEIEEKQEQLIRYKLGRDNNTEGLEKYDESLKNKIKPYFIWELEFARVFKEKGGFDIVVGNPPYVKIQNIDEETSKYYKEKYSVAKGKFDVYVLFVEKSFNLIKNDGICCYIHPHRFLKVEYGKEIRKYLKDIRGLKRVICFGVEQIFDTATTYTGIFFYNNKNEYIEYAESNLLDLYELDFNKSKYESLKDKWNFGTGIENAILDKIEKQDNSVKDIFKGVYQGLISLGDDIFILKGKMSEKNLFTGYSKELDKDVTIESELMKPLLKGENIKRYLDPNSEIYVFYPHYLDNKNKTKPIEEEDLETNYPLGYDYISNFKEYLIDKKIKYKTNPKYWYSLHRARDLKIFQQTKIITPQLQNYPNFTLDTQAFYSDAGGYCLILSDDKIEDYKYYLGILNSKLMWYFIKNTSTPFNSGYYYFKTKYIEPFRIPSKVDKYKRDEIINIVDDIYNSKRITKNEAEVVVLEHRIDELIYDIYGLNNEEITAIERS